MRENRTYGSEGGEARAFSTPMVNSNRWMPDRIRHDELSKFGQ